MNMQKFMGIYRRLWRQAAVGAIFIGLLGPAVQAQEKLSRNDIPPEILWQEQMHDTWEAMNQKDSARAEKNCLAALQTARQFGLTNGCLTTNLVFLAGIYQSENQPDLARQTLQTAVASTEQALGPDSPGLVMPLEKLANFYYFAERRYDLAAPLCLRMLKIVEHAAPPDDGEIMKRARAVAAVYRVQGQFAQAEPFYRQMLAVAGKMPVAGSGQDLCDGLLATAGFYHEWGKYDQAELLCKQALALRQTAATNHPGAEAQMNLAIALYGLAEIYRGWGRLDEAAGDYSQSESIVEKTSGPDSSELARPLSGWAATLAAQGDTNRALALSQRAFAVTESNLPPGDPVVEDVLQNYAALLEQMKRPGEASTLRQAYQWRVLMYGSAHALRLNDVTEAGRLADQALNLARSFGANDTRLVKSLVQVAEVDRQLGKGDLAEETYRAAIASCEQAVGPNNAEMIFPLQSLANFYYYTKIQYDQVAALYQRILNIVQAGNAPDPLEVARWQRNLGDVYHLEQQDARAEGCYQKALAAAESATHVPAGETVQYLQALGNNYRMDGHWEQAEAVLKRALAIREQAIGSDFLPDAALDVAVCCDDLGKTYLAWNKPELAESFYRRLLAIGEKISGPDSLELSSRLLALATALRAEKKYQDAADQYKRALTIHEKAAGTDSAQLADMLDAYADLLAVMQKTEDAKGMHDWAASVRKEIAMQN